MLQHRQAAGAKALFAQQPGNDGRAAGIVAQHQQAYTAVQVGIERGDGACHHRQRDHVLQGPAHPRGRQGKRRRRRQYLHVFPRHYPRQAGADAKQHGVAAGQYAGRRVALGQHRRQGKRPGPGLALGADAGGQQVELALAANHPARAQQGAARILAQPGKAVLTYSHNC
jgi:hypothetical protein